MSINKHHGGKSGHHGHKHEAQDKGVKLKGTNGDDILTGTERNDDLSGRKGNDLLVGLGGNDKLKGGKGDDRLLGGDGNDRLDGGTGNDFLDGGAGNDLLIGRAGDDLLFGGAGNDILVGDGGTGGKHWGWNHCHWWKPKGQDDDYLDGGAGSDLVLAGKGDDVANYTLSENTRAHDVYDGGKGFDTLQLTVTYAELQLASVQKDIAAFEAFLDRKANPKSDDGKTFHFQGFDLDVRNFEALEIVLLNAPPVAQNDAYALDEDSVLLVASPGVTGNDSDLEGSVLGAVVVTGPAHGTLALNADGSFSYTPEANFNGADSFTYKVNDGDLDSNVATVALQVAPVNDAPVAAADSFTTDEDTPVSGNVLGNDTDVDSAALTAMLVDGPVHGTLALQSDGSFSYAPDVNFFGADSFTYRASDGALGSNIATVTLAIAAVNDAPVANADSFTTDEDTPVGGNVLANDADVDSAMLTAVLVDGPVHGSLTLQQDGSFSYTPDVNFFGADSFTYRASDGTLDSGVATVSLAVAPVNDAPVAMDDTIAGSGAGGGPLRVAVIGGTTSTFVAAAAQLEDSTAFAIDAEAIAVATFATEAAWATALAEFDVVVLGGSGGGNDYGDSPVFAALRDFVDAGGGVVTTGWFAQALEGVPALTQADADYITPIAPVTPDAFAFAANLSTITIGSPAHPIAGGISSYQVAALFHELALAVDSGASSLATGPATSGGTLPAIVYDEVGQGLTVYLGSLHLASGAYFPELIRTGAADTIFEQAVAWAAGEPGSGATTDEDTVYVIDDATLLANDTDVEGDALSIFSVAATSSLGAAVSIDASGNVVYDPTSGLQYLDDGEVVTDTFTYTVSDGNGGTDTATVSLTVQGENDTPQAEFDATSTDADTVIVGNVLANDFDPEGDSFTLLTIGQLTTEYGALVTLAADGTFSYDPTGSAALQALPAGQSVVDFFEYSIGDAMGGTSTATASFTVAGHSEPGSGAGKILNSVPAGTELDYYIRFEDSSPEWLRLEGFSMGLANNSTVGGGGAGAGKATGLDIGTLLGSSQTLVQLTEALASGKHLKGVEIEAYLPGGDKGGNLIDQFYFEDVLVTSLQTGGNEFSTANQLGFDYARFNHGHVDYKDTGTVEQITEAGWDFVLNKNATGAGPSIAGDALKADLDDALPLGVNLKYYVTYEGADGWLELDSFSMGLASTSTIGGGGGSVGKLTTTGASLGLGSSAQILELTQGLTSGKHFKDLEVEAYRSGGDKSDVLVDQYYFQDVLVSSLNTSNASSNQVEVNFGAFSHGHIDYKDDGTKGDVTEAGWSFIQNKDFSVPVDADLF